jgi:hypothetical protein
MQAAMVCQCEARGIELDSGRMFVARQFENDFQEQRRRLHLYRDNRDYIVGKTSFVEGSLQAEEHRNFLTTTSAGNSVIKAFCNNFNGVFAERSAKKEGYVLDDYIAGLFALMPPGSILVTLHQLTLVSARRKMQSERKKHGLDDGLSLNASFYEMETILLGKMKDVVSWGEGCETNLYVYKYSRLRQATSSGCAVFQCSNPNCHVAQAGTAIPATKTVFKKGEQRIVINTCECKVDNKPVRRRTQNASYKEVESDAEFD